MRSSWGSPNMHRVAEIICSTIVDARERTRCLGSIRNCDVLQCLRVGTANKFDKKMLAEAWAAILVADRQLSRKTVNR
jgi:hypothetical protein